jgi:hypothetical protein
MNSFIVAITAGHARTWTKACGATREGLSPMPGSQPGRRWTAAQTRPMFCSRKGPFAVQWGANTQFFPEAGWKRQIDTMGAIKEFRGSR